MIKLKRLDNLETLMPDREKALTEEYKKTGKPVWRQPDIVDALEKLSHKKCCYCETKLGEQAKPLHVEHYYCKDIYPEKVVSWKNLLPSCSQCNSNKGAIDMNIYPILDPTKDDPKDYFYLKHAMLKSKDNRLDSKGRFTIEQLELNNRERLVTPRLKVADSMSSKLKSIYSMAVSLKERTDGKMYNKSRVVNGIRDILMMAQPSEEYSAFMSTIVLDDDDFIETCEILKELSLWNRELDILKLEAEKIKLETTNKIDI